MQTLENNPAILHGGPFANIAHGCNSVIATRASLKLADYVVTEAASGPTWAPRSSSISSAASPGCGRCGGGGGHCAGAQVPGRRGRQVTGHREHRGAARGLVNLERHVHNLREQFGLPCVVAINHFTADTEAELALLQARMAALGVPVQIARHWAEGGAGAEALARAVVSLVDAAPAGGAGVRFVYDDAMPLLDKAHAIATRLYGAAGVQASAAVREQLRRLEAAGHGQLPVCIAKTPYSFSDRPPGPGRTQRPHAGDPRGAVGGGRRFCRVALRQRDDHAGLPKLPSAERSTSTRRGGWWACSERPTPRPVGRAGPASPRRPFVG